MTAEAPKSLEKKGKQNRKARNSSQGNKEGTPPNKEEQGIHPSHTFILLCVCNCCPNLASFGNCFCNPFGANLTYPRFQSHEFKNKSSGKSRDLAQDWSAAKVLRPNDIIDSPIQTEKVLPLLP